MRTIGRACSAVRTTSVTGRIMNVRRRASRRSLPIWRRPKRRPPTRRAGWNLLSRTAPSWNWTGPPWPKPWSRSLFLSTAGLRLHIPFPTTWGFYAPFESLDQIRAPAPHEVVPAPLLLLGDSVLQLTSPSDRRTIPSNESIILSYLFRFWVVRLSERCTPVCPEHRWRRLGARHPKGRNPP